MIRCVLHAGGRRRKPGRSSSRSGSLSPELIVRRPGPSVVLGALHPRIPSFPPVGLLLAVVCPWLCLALAWPGLAHAGGAITDLPFLDMPGGTPGNGDGYAITCSWHQYCDDWRLYPQEGMRAIDFQSYPPNKWGLHAPGHGEVITAEGKEWGNTVEIRHPDGQTSQLYHLHYIFVSKGMPVCRFVALGTAGKTGKTKDGRDMGPHIHFGTKNMPRFAPIRGAGSHEYSENDFILATPGPRPTPSPTPVIIHHDCGGRCSSHTRAYTVDDSQNSKHCASCTVDEFVMHGDWSDMAVGFAYRDFEKNGKTWYTFVTYSDPPRLRTAEFRPMLRYIDPAWSVYAFVPVYNNYPSRHPEVVAPAVKYEIVWYDSIGQQHVDTFIVDQSQNAGKWVRIGGTYPTSWTPYDPPEYMPQPLHRGLIPLGTRVPPERQFPLILRVNNEPVGQCLPSPGNQRPCYDKHVFADAALFVPSDCGP